MTVPLLITAEDAQAAYDALGNDDWKTDSRCGRFFALQIYVEHAFVRILCRAEKRGQGARQPKALSIPAWVAPTLDEFMVEFRCVGPFYTGPVSDGLGRLLLSAEGRGILELMVSGGVEEALAGLDAKSRAALERDYMPSVRAQFKKLPPRAHPTVQSFFHGTCAWFYFRQRPDPTAKTLALLAAATGIEPITEGMKLARKRWDERLYRWRRQMDQVNPSWRESIGTAPVRSPSTP